MHSFHPDSGFRLAGFVSLLLVASCALTKVYASNGVLEISQSCVAAGCLPGDAPGFPVEITASGSYVLTSNIAVADENTTAIYSSADSVSIDLGGFTISGVTTCSGTSPLVCTQTGTGNGVEIQAGKAGSILNGTVRNMGDTGIRSFEGLIENVVVKHNGGSGIINSFGVVQNNVARENGEAGIECFTCLMQFNVVTNNGAYGIVGAGLSRIRINQVESNGIGGGMTGPGIIADGFIENNSVSSNRGAGLVGTSVTIYGGNVFQANEQSGTPDPTNQVTGGDQFGANYCHGVLCP